MQKIISGILFFCASTYSVFAQVYDVSVASFPRLQGEVSDTPRIQRAIAASECKVLYFPKGTYELDAGLKVANAASLLMHKSAYFKAIKPMDIMLDYDANRASLDNCGDGSWAGARGRFDHNLFIQGGVFDANGLANTCVRLFRFVHFKFADTTFRNPRKYGLYVGAKYPPSAKDNAGNSCELIATNLYFWNNLSGLAGNTAVYDGDSDCHFTDCVVVDYTIGFNIPRGTGASRFTRCHVWGGPIPARKGEKEREMLKNSIAFVVGGHDTILRDCYADTSKIGFKVDGWRNRILGCSYFNNYAFKLDDVTVIEHTGGSTLVVDGCLFAKDSPKATLYKGDKQKHDLIWLNNMLRGFSPEDEFLVKGK